MFLIGFRVISWLLFINKNCCLLVVFMIVNCMVGMFGFIIGMFLDIMVIILVLIGMLFVGLLLLGMRRIFFLDRFEIFILM